MIAVIGDGAISAGMAYEAMNNAGAMERGAGRLLVILNDNEMSISPPTGAMSAYLTRLMSSRKFLSLRELGFKLAKRPPRPRRAHRQARRGIRPRHDRRRRHAVRGARASTTSGPIDGHNLDHLMPVLRNLREQDGGEPVLLHVITQKGRGYAPAEAGRRQAPRGHREVQPGDRRAGQGAQRAAVLHGRVRRKPDCRRRGRSDRSWRSRPRCPPAPGSTQFAQTLPRPPVRRRHRRAARGDLRRRARGRRHAAVLRDLLDVPAAGLRPGGARRGAAGLAGAVRDRPRRAWWVPTAPRTPARST